METSNPIETVLGVLRDLGKNNLHEIIIKIVLVEKVINQTLVWDFFFFFDISNGILCKSIIGILTS